MVAPIVIVGILLASIAGPIAVDIQMGDNINPDDGIAYQVEGFGEYLRNTLIEKDNPTYLQALGQERIQEATTRINKLEKSHKQIQEEIQRRQSLEQKTRR